MHLPDGNATLARLLVGSLVPSAFAARSMETGGAARVNYARLETALVSPRNSLEQHRRACQTRRRSVNGPRSRRSPTSAAASSARARERLRHGVLEHVDSPSVPELPDAQKEALAYGVKAPIVYTSVLIRDWTAFAKLGVSDISAPDSYHTA